MVEMLLIINKKKQVKNEDNIYVLVDTTYNDILQ